MICDLVSSSVATNSMNCNLKNYHVIFPNSGWNVKLRMQNFQYLGFSYERIFDESNINLQVTIQIICLWKCTVWKPMVIE